MTKQQKIRKNINVSIQSKKYNEPINDVLTNWEDEGLNISTEVCNSILLANKIANSPTLLNVMNIYDLAEKILNLYQVDEVENSLEDILSKLINVNGSELTEVINATFNGDYNTPKKTSKPKQSKKLQRTDEVADEDDIEEKTVSKAKDNHIEDSLAVASDEDNGGNEPTNFEYSEDDEYAIPNDILFNS